jgi:cell division protein FtsI/penicillin-binding protein 2
MPRLITERDVENKVREGAVPIFEQDSGEILEKVEVRIALLAQSLPQIEDPQVLASKIAELQVLMEHFARLKDLPLIEIEAERRRMILEGNTIIHGFQYITDYVDPEREA